MPASTANGPDLHPMTEELAAGRNFAAVSTILPSGKIQTQMIWVDPLDVLNTEVHRAKHHNIERDQRVTVLIRDEQDPYRYAEIRAGSRTPRPARRPTLPEIATRRPYPRFDQRERVARGDLGEVTMGRRRAGPGSCSPTAGPVDPGAASSTGCPRSTRASPTRSRTSSPSG